MEVFGIKDILKEDFEWLQKNYKANQQPNITREFSDSNNLIAFNINLFPRNVT